MLKAEENPPIAWPEEESICDFIGTWWVAHTKSRNEKALAHDLIAKNISYFLPMSWKTRHLRRRKTRSLLPLFSGYLFFCGNEVHRLETLRTNRVANIIEVEDQPKLITELSQIQQAIQSGVSLQPHNYIKAGQVCTVLAGPLAGLRGTVLKTKTSARLILKIDMLGQAASVEIDTDSIETIDENSQ
ncbi:MAG: transcription termination/antitermination protein NusG [Planctomycetota bacterium]